jgi:hypothetical protein
MIEGTPLNQLAQQLIAERQMQRDFVADTRRLTPHPVGAAVSIELQHADGFTAVAPSRFALGQFASRYKIPMACVDRMTQAGAGSLLGQNLLLVCRATVDAAAANTHWGNRRAMHISLTPVPSVGQLRARRSRDPAT